MNEVERLDLRLDLDEKTIIKNYCKKNKISITKLLVVSSLYFMNENKAITKSEIKDLILYYKGELKSNE